MFLETMVVGSRRRACFSYIHSGEDLHAVLSREITMEWKDILARRGEHHSDCESCDVEGSVKAVCRSHTDICAFSANLLSYGRASIHPL